MDKWAPKAKVTVLWDRGAHEIALREAFFGVWKEFGLISRVGTDFLWFWGSPIALKDLRTFLKQILGFKSYLKPLMEAFGCFP